MMITKTGQMRKLWQWWGIQQQWDSKATSSTLQKISYTITTTMTKIYWSELICTKKVTARDKRRHWKQVE